MTMTQKSCLSIPVSEGCVVALKDVPEPRGTPSGKGFAWESESVPRGATTCYSSNTSDYVVVDPQDGATFPKTLPEVSSEAHVAESSHGRPKVASNIDDGNTVEFGLEQCVKDSSKPIEVKEKFEATREQRLAYVDEQLPRPEGGCPDVTPIIESPPISQVVPELRRMTWLEFTNTDSSQRHFPALEVLIGEAWHPSFKDTNAGQHTIIDKIKPSAENMALQGSGSYSKAADRVRINSKSVLSILAEILKQKLTVESPVILHPSKALVYYEEEIRSKLRRLEDEWSTVDREELSTHAPSGVGRDLASSTCWTTKAALLPAQRFETLNIAGPIDRMRSDAALKDNGELNLTTSLPVQQ